MLTYLNILKGRSIVNCAERFFEVDTKALLDALDNGVIKGAALDPYEFARRKLSPKCDQRRLNTERSIVRIVD